MTVDELVVKLGLDASGFKQGVKDATDAAGKLSDAVKGSADASEKAQSDASDRIVKALERIADQGDKLATDNERQNKKIKQSTDATGESIVALGRKFLGLYILLTANRSIKSFVSDITSADAALGRTAKNLDITGKSLSAWQNAATVAGGSAEGITGTLKGLTSEMQRAALTGQSSIIPAFRALGINLADAKGHARDATDVLRDLNKVYNEKHLDPATFTEIAHMAGIDDGTIALLEKTTAEFTKLIDEQQKYAANAADIDAAQKRQSGWRQLLITSESLGRSILTNLTPAIVGAMTAVQRWTDANQEWLKGKVDEYAKRIGEWVKSVDWAKVATDVGTFVSAVGTIAGAVAGAVGGVDENSALSTALTALGVLVGVTLVGRFASLVKAIGSLSAVALPGWFAKLIGVAVGTTAGLTTTALVAGAVSNAEMARRTGHAMTSGDPNAKFDPETGFVNDLDFGYGDKGANAGGNKALAWFKGLFGGQPGGNTDGNALRRNDETPASSTQSGGVLSFFRRLVGLEDAKPKDDLAATAKATGEIRDLMKVQKDGLGGGAVATFGMPSNTGAAGAGAPSLRRGRGADGQYRRTPTGGGGRSYADTPSGQGRAAAVKGSEGDRAMQAMRYLVEQKGYTPEGAAIAIGNAIQESGVTPNGRPGDPNTPGGSHYMFQWNNGRNNDTVNGRRAKYERWARENGRDLNDYRTPLDFFDIERKQRTGLEGQWHQQRDLRNAGRLGHLFEGYGDNSEGTRVQNARDLLDKWNQGKRGNPTAQAPVPAGTSDAAIGDAAAFAAEQRLKAGGTDPKDRALLDRYRAQQNAPKAAQAPSVGDAARHLLHFMYRAGRLSRHDNDNKPVAVEDRSLLKLQDRTFGAYLRRTQRHMDIMPPAASIRRASELHRMTRMAAVGAHGGSTVNHSVETRIGEMHVHTPAHDGRQFAGSFRDDMMRRGDVVMGNGALA